MTTRAGRRALERHDRLIYRQMVNEVRLERATRERVAKRKAKAERQAVKDQKAAEKAARKARKGRT